MNKEVEKVIETIENADLKALAEDLVRTIPDYFYHVPASSTGKYHPEYSLGEGGLLRHTVALIRILNYLLEATDEFTSREKDMLRIAGLMHDSRKSGSQEQYDENHCTKFEHPMLAAQVVRKFKGRGYASDKEIEQIAEAIESHMGKWNTSKYSDLVLPIPNNKMQIILHQADYLASRKDLIVQFTTFEQKSEESVNTQSEIVSMPFGKYKGKGIQEIAVEDRQYLEWCLNNMDLRQNLETAITLALS